MKKREIISMIMAISMMISAASCGSADRSGDAPVGGATNNTNGVAEAKSEKSDEADAGVSAEEAAPVAPAAESAKTEATAATTVASPEAADGETYEAEVMGEMADAKSMGIEAGAMKKEKAEKRSEDGVKDVFDTVDGVIAADGEGDEPIIPTEPEAPEESVVRRPEAGQLTAGEWNDNDNWGFFTNLVNSGTIKFPSFSLDPTTRCAVTVKSADNTPVVNANVRLLDEDGKVIWRAVSDKKGRAYLFTSGSAVPAKIEAEVDGEVKTADYKAPETDGQGNKKASASSVEIIMDNTGKLNKDMQVMFIVDTTGSMSDEMLFLQSEFSAITREIGTADTEYAVSFYRDEGDEYITKHNGFTSSVDELQKALNNENADGGGDYPEAVAQVLTETMTKNTEWSKDSVKLAFLIFDAPPHEGTEKELLAAAKAACEKGIRIVPVVSSDSDRDTELFARSLAIMSGGTYVFLTDDSGIGGGHLEPIIGDYKVEKLYDIIIRVINDYRQ